MTPIPTQYIYDATEAAIAVARHLGLARVQPIVLDHSMHTSIRLHPFDVVARVSRAVDKNSLESSERELAVVRHLVAKQAPVVSPVTQWSAGPHRFGNCLVSLWRFIEHVPADEDNATHVISAATALRQVHKALVDCPVDLPVFTLKTDRCRSLLEDETSLLALNKSDRIFLLRVYRQIMSTLDQRRLALVPLHGDAHLANVLITPQGALWNDFYDASHGPIEWDIGWFPDETETQGGTPDPELQLIVSDLRSLCVSVWCWDKYEMPNKKEAADFHLGHLKERFA